jgi:hypothetical protein
MSAGRTFFQLIKADVLERTRRRSFLVTVAATLLLGYLVADGTIGLHLGHYRGVMNAPWVGLLMALCGTTFVSLFGFYAVKNAVARDRQTGVGQILAATPISRMQYLAAKTLSNFIVLAVVITLLALAAVLLLLIRREEGTVDVRILLPPFLFLALPAMAFTAALAVFFESTPGLRGGFGNVAFFFVWTLLLVLPLATGSLLTDVTGVRLAMDRLQADIRTLAPDYDGYFTLGTDGGVHRDTIPLRWRGMNWTAPDIAWRLLPLGWAAALVALAALVFDRFDARVPLFAGAVCHRGRWSGGGRFLQKPPELALRLPATVLNRSLFGRMLLAELRLMLQALPWWWHPVALTLWALTLVEDPAFSRTYLLPWLCLWPMFLWSAMGMREIRDRTGPMLFSCPRPVLRQLPALWAAGVLVACTMVSGLGVRLFIAGDFGVALAIGAGALFVPTLALALGIWSGGTTTFEVVYFLAWYVGPLQHTPSLDFMATSDASVLAGTPVIVLLLTGVLGLAAVVGRLRFLRL